jgi:Flp pilus assembly pilin Flp
VRIPASIIYLRDDDVDLTQEASGGDHRGHCDRGATSVEYALLLALIAAVIVGAVAIFGTQVAGLYEVATEGW